MLQNRYIIITSIQSWNITIGSNIKNIASELARHNTVLFVNPPADRITKLKGMAGFQIEQDEKESLCEVQENLWVLEPDCVMESINKIPVDTWFDYLNKRNSYLLGNEILKTIRKLGFSDYIHICDSDMFRSQYLKEILKPSVFAYYSRDNLVAVNYWKRHGGRAEPAIMQKADVVLTNSQYLEKLAKVHNACSYFVGQGCDTSAYGNAVNKSIPQEINQIGASIIGYIGSLNSLRLDINIIEYLATHRPEWNIVLVGPEDEAFQKSLLHKFVNVHFLGSKKESDLPQYLNAFDVAINPQLLNEVTIGNYPRKIDEYLAMGKAVVATKTEAMAYFAEHVFLASSANEWLLKIDRALSDQDQSLQKQRMAFASLHTWQNNVKEIGRRILKIEQQLNRVSKAS
ncbi:MAG: glycosyltransferase [Carboxylicivirga sp.]|nr:glycosyltransferase [Carboxylicivirga sp.]